MKAALEDLFPEYVQENLGVNILKVKAKGGYSEKHNSIVIQGTMYNCVEEDYSMWSSVETDKGLVTCLSRSKGAFAIGTLKGKQAFIEVFTIALRIQSYPDLQRIVNLCKLKNSDLRKIHAQIDHTW